MNTTKRHLAALALPCIASGILFNAQPALAQEAEPPAVTAPADVVSAIDNLNETKQVKLTIHKYLGDPIYTDSTHGLPLQDAPEGTQPLDGVVFNVQKITDLDVKNPEHWTTFSELSPANLNGHPLGQATQITTGPDGTVAHSFDQGFYLITEEAAPGRTVIAPTLIALPMTNAADTSTWNYDVHIHPKNQQLGVEKTVQDAGKHAGDIITYTIAGDVPLARQGTDKLDYYALQDNFDETRVTPNTDALVVSLGGTPLDAKDYRIEARNDGGDERFAVMLTDSGLTKAASAREGNPDLKVTVTVEATLLNDNFGEASNKAYLFAPLSNVEASLSPDEATTLAPPDETPTSEVVTKTAAVKLTKESSVDATKLQGATFELHTCELDSPTVKDRTAITIGGASSFTTDDQGVVTIKGIHATNFANNEAVDPDSRYCLVETRAPKGFELLAQPVVLDNDALNAALTVPMEVTIPNVPGNGGFRLPVTGGMGAWLIVGLGALAGVGALALRRQRG